MDSFAWLLLNGTIWFLFFRVIDGEILSIQIDLISSVVLAEEGVFLLLLTLTFEVYPSGDGDLLRLRCNDVSEQIV